MTSEDNAGSSASLRVSGAHRGNDSDAFAENFLFRPIFGRNQIRVSEVPGDPRRSKSSYLITASLACSLSDATTTRVTQSESKHSGMDFVAHLSAVRDHFSANQTPFFRATKTGCHSPLDQIGPILSLYLSLFESQFGVLFLNIAGFQIHPRTT